MLKFSAILIITLNLGMCQHGTSHPDNQQVYSVGEFVRTYQHKYPCGKESEMENTAVRIEGRFSTFHFTPETGQIILFDLDDEDLSIEIRYDNEGNSEVENMLSQEDGQTVQINGTVRGYDQRKNFTCRRALYVQLVSASGLIMPD